MGKGWNSAMALTQCSECGGQVSTGAATCPHCGIASPAQDPERYQGERTYNRIKGWIWFLVIAAGAVFILRLAEHRSPPDQEATAATSLPSAPPKTFDEANRELSECIMPEAQYGRYSSFDGGKSAEKLIEEKCTTQYLAFLETCKGSGDTEKEKTCSRTALIAAQMAIKQWGK
jgi:hypothetical protein